MYDCVKGCFIDKVKCDGFFFEGGVVFVGGFSDGGCVVVVNGWCECCDQYQ